MSQFLCLILSVVKVFFHVLYRIIPIAAHWLGVKRKRFVNICHSLPSLVKLFNLRMFLVRITPSLFDITTSENAGIGDEQICEHEYIIYINIDSTHH